MTQKTHVFKVFYLFVSLMKTLQCLSVIRVELKQYNTAQR